MIGILTSWHLGRYGAAAGTESKIIPLESIEEVETAEQGSQKYKDAVAPKNQHTMMGMLTQPMGAMMSPYSGTVSKPFCLVVKRAAKPMGAVDSVMGIMGNTSGLGMAFGGGAQKMQKAVEDNASRTYYFSFSSASERDAFAQALRNNIACHRSSPAALQQKQVRARFTSALRLPLF